MGHIGLTPQPATMLGGFKAQGRSAEKALRLLADARALEAAGCFSLVLEAVPAAVAARIPAGPSLPRRPPQTSPPPPRARPACVPSPSRGRRARRCRGARATRRRRQAGER